MDFSSVRPLWQDAIAIPDATAPTVATVLDERVFCYFGLPEQIHSDLGRQFKSQLMAELCTLWRVPSTTIHSQMEWWKEGIGCWETHYEPCC